MSNPSNTALATLTKSDGRHFSPKPAALLAKLAQLAKLDAQGVQLAIQVGALLWQTKARLKHGEFQPWIRANIQGRSYRQCAYFMKLALVFVEKAKLSEPAFAALLELDLDTESRTGVEADVVAAMAAFSGELSLTELLIKHGIKGVGLKSELEGGEAPAELTEAQREQMSLDLVWSQAYEPAKSLADLLVERAAALTPDRRAAITAELTRALHALRAC